MKNHPIGREDLNEDLEFTPGQRYNRKALHEVFGGQHQGGISTPSDTGVIFIFTGESGEKYGYYDEFLSDGTFLYTGEGTEGDMEWERGNSALRDHHEDNKEVHLFEETDEAWVVTYVGEYEYAGHRETQLHDRYGNMRKAIQFELEPVGGLEITVPDVRKDRLSQVELYQRAAESLPTQQPMSPTTTETRRYTRAEIVRDFALRTAGGVCQGCGDDAPFVDNRGNPFLEVHHLYRQSDGGADHPDNVIALCPNCHRRVHYGKMGKISTGLYLPKPNLET